MLNGFDKNVQFIIDWVENEILHSLDLEMALGMISIFGKDTNTGLYAIYASFVYWNHCTAWIRSLVTPALKICPSNKLSQVKINQNLPNFTKKHKEPLTVCFRFPYCRYQGFQLLKSCISKIKVNCKNDQPVVFKILYDVWSSLVIPNSEFLLSINLVVYEFTCLGCGANYLEKPRECYMNNVLSIHGVIRMVLWKSPQPVCWSAVPYMHFILPVLYITNLGPALFSGDNNIGIADHVNSRISLVIDNAKIINRYKNFSILLFKEEGKINEIKPTLNTALKASKKLQLFIVYCNVLLPCH